MSYLRDELVALFSAEQFTCAEFMDSASVDSLADATLALLKQEDPWDLLWELGWRVDTNIRRQSESEEGD